MTALGKLFRTTAFKLSLAWLVIFAIGAGLVIGRVGWNVKTLVDEQISQTLDAEITGLSEQYAQGGIRQLVQAIDRRARGPGAALYLLTTFSGEKVAGNVAVLPPGILSQPGYFETDYQRAEGVEDSAPDKDDHFRPPHRALAQIFVLPGGFRLLVGHDLNDRESLRRILGSALMSSLLWLIILGTAGSLFVARRVLRRVDAMTASAQSIMAGDLTGRLPLAGTGDELDRLAKNLNAMLERIGELMSGLREVSDNIAHDLKTPLTRLRNGAEQALRMAKNPDEHQAALAKIIDEADGLIRIFNALLMIARAEAGTLPESMVDLDAGDIARDLAELYEPVAEESGLQLAAFIEPNLPVHASRELLGQALANLVDNALKYGMKTLPSPGHKGASKPLPDVTIFASNRPAGIEISVADHGPGIAVADRARVLERFVRLEGSRSRPGSGLGLSLAAAVARLHGGTLRLEDNAPGLRVVLGLPKRSANQPSPSPSLLPSP